MPKGPLMETYRRQMKFSGKRTQFKQPDNKAVEEAWQRHHAMELRRQTNREEQVSLLEEDTVLDAPPCRDSWWIRFWGALRRNG